MVCKRCGVEFSPEGSICPFCGAKQEAYINERKKRASSPEKRRNSSILAMAVIFVAIVAIGAFYTPQLAPIITGEARRLELVSDIEKAYEERNEASLEILVSRFLQNYPGSPEEERFVAMVKEVTGLMPIGSTPEPTVDPEYELETWLLENAREHVITVPLLEMSGPNSEGAFTLAAGFVNRSEKTVSRVIFEVEFYDSSGNPILSSTSGKSKVAAVTRGVYTPSDTVHNHLWIAAFTNPDAASIKLISVRVDYEDGEFYHLKGEVVDTLLG